MIGTTDQYGQSQINRQEAESAAKVSELNGKAIVQTAEDLKNELLPRMDRLEKQIVTLKQQHDDLQRKYDLLLTERFNKGTVVDGHPMAGGPTG